MIANRLHGLANLQVAATVTVASLLLLAFENVLRYVPLIKVEPSVNLLPYLLCVIGGMIISARYLLPIASRFHRLTWVDAARLTTRQVMVMALMLFACMFVLKDRTISRLFIGTYLLLAWSVLLFVNLGLPRFMSRLLFGQGRRVPTLFIGSQQGLERLKNWLASKQILGLRPVGYLSEGEPPRGESSLPFLGGLVDLPRMIDSRQVMQVVVIEIPRTHGGAQFIVETCQNKGCRLLIHDDFAEQLQHPLVTVAEEGHRFYALVGEPLEDPLNRMLKRIFDVVLSLAVVLFFLPMLMLWVWVMQRLQAPGRLFFKQDRTGHGQQSFRMIKFRSMYEIESDARQETKQARRHDDRVFPFGRFLRRTSLDEFPQFLNVLKGDMSIVGPRPHMVAHDREFSHLLKGYRTRFFVKPGITGLAQCNGCRGEITDPVLLTRRVEHDLTYVTQWSIWLDLQITLRTVWHVLFPPRTAY